MKRSPVVRFTAPVLIGVVVGTVLWANAGSLSPPPGPVAPSMKTLTEVEPRIPLDATHTPGDATYHFIISQPGSYYLTGNLAVSLNSGIQVTASNVTLDLNGFQVRRAAGTGGDGINVELASLDCTIKNGSISGFNNGILCVPDDLTPHGGLLLRQLVVSTCTTGISAGSGAQIEECYARDNKFGFVAGSCTMTHCTADRNIGGSEGRGFIVSGTLINCTATRNETLGIDAGSGSTLINCVAISNSIGISASYGSTLMNCSASSNRTGISVSRGCTLTNCAAANNQGTGSVGVGIVADYACALIHCTAYGNKVDGIQVGSGCRVLENTCEANGQVIGGAGIHAISTDNRIEANNVTNNNRGILVDGTGNLIFKNCASGNSNNYIIAATNKVGVIVNAPDSAAISGSTGGAGMGTTDPWANMSY